MASVAFDIAEFKKDYPAFANLSDDVLNNYFVIAERFCDNTDASLVTDLTERKVLLYLLVAHIATLSMRGTFVGFQKSAHQGSVSTGFSLPNNLNWYKQSQYGYLFWVMTRKYRQGGMYYEFKREN